MEKDLLHLKVIREVLSQISLGVFKDVQRLPAERKLCQQFEISRGTLRRALADLEKMGVLQIRAQSGAYVQKIPKSGVSHPVFPKDVASITLREIIFARKAIELAAIELVGVRSTKSDIKYLYLYIDRMEANADNLPEYLKYDIGFHDQLVKSSPNPALIAAFEAIADYHKYSQVFSNSSETCEAGAMNHHRRILAALTAGNPSKAVAALRRHFDSMLERDTSF